MPQKDICRIRTILETVIRHVCANKIYILAIYLGRHTQIIITKSSASNALHSLARMAPSPTSSSPILSTSRLNNDGVSLLESGRLLEAMEYFQECIDQLFELQMKMWEQEYRDTATPSFSKHSDCCSESTCSTSSSSSSSDASSSCSSSPFKGWSEPALDSTLVLQDNTQSASVFLYSRAILLREEEGEASTSTSAARLSAYSTALHFNNALAHHLLLLTSQEHRTTANACISNKYYEESYRQYMRTANATNKQPTPDNDSFDLLRVALFNNMGAIYCNELARFRDANECFKAACGALGEIGEDEWHPLDGDEIYLLSMNTFMVPTSTSPAA